MEQYQHFKNGQFVDPHTGEWFETENPYLGEVWAKIAKETSSVNPFVMRQRSNQTLI